MGTGSVAEPFSFPRQRWLSAALILFFVGLSIQYSFKVSDDQRSAILRWRPQIQQIHEVDIYQRFAYPNPPMMALLLEPIVALPPFAASLLWFYLKVGMTLVAIAWVFRLVEEPHRPIPIGAQVATVLLSLRPIIGDLSHGNVNLFILFLVVGALTAYHRRFDFSAGLALALAITCKVTPALFVPYLVWKRAWRVLAGISVGIVLFVVFVPGLVLGMERNLDLFQSWYGSMVRPYVEAGTVTTDHPNQSLPGLLYRWFTPGASFYDKGVPRESSTIVVVSPLALRWALRCCMVAFAGAVVWSCRTPTEPRHGWKVSAEFGLILLGMLLFSERTWKHHCVTLLVPFAVVCYYLAVFRRGMLLRFYLFLTLLAAALFMTATSTGWFIPWDHAARLAQADGAYVWANLSLTVCLIVLLRIRT